MTDNTIHPSYVAPAIADNMPDRFEYLRPGQVNSGLTGEPRVPRYGDTGSDTGGDD